MAKNLYYAGGWKFYNSGTAGGLFQVADGSFDWISTGTTTGSAGGTASPSTFMSLTNTGNLLVGLTTNVVGAKLASAGGIGTTNAVTQRFSTVEYGSGASGTFTTITISFSVDNTPASVILEVLMTGYDAVYLDHVAARYGGLGSVVMRNNASSGTTVSSLAISGSTYTLTITTGVTHPVVKIKATSGGIASGFANGTLPIITFA